MLSFHLGMALLVVRFTTVAPVPLESCVSTFASVQFQCVNILLVHFVLYSIPHIVCQSYWISLDLIVWYIVWTGMCYLLWFQDVFADEIRFDYNFILLLLLFAGVYIFAFRFFFPIFFRCAKVAFCLSSHRLPFTCAFMNIFAVCDVCIGFSCSFSFENVGC